MGVVGDHIEIETSRQIKGKGIAGDESDLRPICPCAERFEHIDQHGLRQLRAGAAVEHGRQALLGVGEVLDGDKDHGGSEAARAALSVEISERTVRAKAAFSSAVRMIVCAQCTRSPDCCSSSAAFASRTSAINVSRKS